VLACDVFARNISHGLLCAGCPAVTVTRSRGIYTRFPCTKQYLEKEPAALLTVCRRKVNVIAQKKNRPDRCRFFSI